MAAAAAEKTAELCLKLPSFQNTPLSVLGSPPPPQTISELKKLLCIVWRLVKTGQESKSRSVEKRRG